MSFSGRFYEGKLHHHTGTFDPTLMHKYSDMGGSLQFVGFVSKCQTVNRVCRKLSYFLFNL